MMQESYFGGFDDDDDDDQDNNDFLKVDGREMQEKHNNHVSDDKDENSVMLVPTKVHEVPGGFDVCGEYGYQYEYDAEENESEPDEEEEDQRGLDEDALLLDVSTNMMAGTTLNPAVARYCLGKQYHPIRDYDKRRDDEMSLFWFTYRCEFPEMVPYRITTDAGWGCMLRSAQMMLAQALRVHFRSREWKPPLALAKKRADPFLRNIMTWFADFPSKDECRYSVHNMSAAGVARYETLPGEWYGPGTACHVLRDLCNIQEKPQKEKREKERSGGYKQLFRVHVATGGVVYKDEVDRLMTRDNQAQQKNAAAGKKKIVSGDPLLHPLHEAGEKEVQTKPLIEWDTALLLLVPLRLGLKGFNPEYSIPLTHTISFPQSVGFVGGSPRHALWFFGATADGSEVYGLDPHTVQDAPRKVHPSARREGRTVSLSADYLRSVHCTSPSRIRMPRIDPSLALGFYCQNKKDFDNLCYSINLLKGWCAERGAPDLFVVEDEAPDYAADDSVLLASMTHSSCNFDDDQEHEKADDDEDDFVML